METLIHTQFLIQL